MKLIALASFLLLTACTSVSGPDPRDGFSERNIGSTVVTHVGRLGTQAVYFEPSGALYLWSSAKPNTQVGAWKYDLLATGSAATYQGSAGINYSVEELETDWGICFQYKDAAGNILRRREGGDWNCALFADFEALVIDKAPGDVFALAEGRAPAAMPPDARLPISALRGL